MKDLYRRLGVSADASIVEIREALERAQGLSQEDREDIRHVLLDPVRRKAYDRAHRALRTIAVVREATHTDDTGFGAGSIYRDFRASSGSKTKRRSAADPEPQAPGGTSSEGRPGWDSDPASEPLMDDHRIGVAVLAGIGGLILATFIIGSSQCTRSRYLAETSPPLRAPATVAVKPQKPAPEPFFDKRPLDTREVCDAQEMLRDMGLYEGAVDGLAGPQTKRAFSAFFAKTGQSVPVLLSKGSLSRLGTAYRQNPYEKRPSPARRPRTGEFVVPPSRSRIAPFTVVVPQGSDDYLIKLVNLDAPSEAFSVFVRAGGSAEVEVPLGRYEMRYALGERWFGERCLFGMSMGAFRADTPFVFKRSGNRIEGNGVELIKQLNGNLETKSISQQQF